MPQATDQDLEDQEDELPQIVSLKSGDLTQEEYERLRSEGKLDELFKEGDVGGIVEGPKPRDEEEPAADGKIIFRKPTKRNIEEKEGESSEKKQKSEKSEKKDKKQKKKELQKIKLLSFNEDEEEED